MSSKEIICIMCPLGCKLDVLMERETIAEVKGSRCKEGLEYASQETYAPCRILTTTVRSGNPDSPLLPVRSNIPIPKEKLQESMVEISRQVVKGPVRMGQVIINNILGTGADIIASKSVL